MKILLKNGTVIDYKSKIKDKRDKTKIVDLPIWYIWICSGVITTSPVILLKTSIERVSGQKPFDS